MSRKQNASAPIRVTLDLSEKAYDFLEALVRAENAPSKADVLRRAMLVYGRVAEGRSRGTALRLKDFDLYFPRAWR